MRKKIILSLSIVVIVSCLFAFSSCAPEKDYRPKYQGSNVWKISNNAIETPITTSYNSYQEFEKDEEVSNIKNQFGDKIKTVFYNKFYFEEKKLILTRFSAMANSNFFINKIIVNKNTINVELIKFPSNETAEKCTYGLFLESPTYIANPIVQIGFVEEETIAYSRLYLDSIPSDIDKSKTYIVNSKEALKSKVNVETNMVIDKVLEQYDDSYFEKQNLAVLYLKTNPYPEFMISIKDNKIVVETYCSDHYINDGDKNKTANYLILIPLEKNSLVDEYIINEKWEDEFNEDREVVTIQGKISE